MLKTADSLAFVDLAEVDPIARLLDMSEKGDEWHVDDSSLEEYSVLAGLPEDFSTGLGGMILRSIGNGSGNVGIDIAGGTNGAALQQLLKPGTLEKALVTNYTDARSDETKAVVGLDHIEGDLCDRATWEEIDGWIDENAPGGLSLVMHRPAGTLQDLPAPFYAGAFRFLLERTRPGGLHFLQIPEPLVIPSPERSLKPVYEEIEDSVEVLFSNVNPDSDFPVIPAHVLLRKN
ncbi:MAG TPA: hypothetical protein VFW77_01205 [Candidatus Saccharimonadales bacterium]|nr:hypothetical protein [Candidatus Saccharimonadales bacterium]